MMRLLWTGLLVLGWFAPAQALERVITTRAGYENPDGTAETAVVEQPGEIAVDSQGRIYFGDMGPNLVRRLDPTRGTVETLAGDGHEGNGGNGGPPRRAQLDWPMAMELDEARGLLYTTDFGHHDVRVINFGRTATRVCGVLVRPNTIERIAGTGQPSWEAPLGDDGPALQATLAYPRGLALDRERNVYVADIDDARVRRIDQQTGIITTVAGTGDYPVYPDVGDGGPAVDAKIIPTTLGFDHKGALYIGSGGYNPILDLGVHVVRRVDPRTGLISTVAGSADAAPGGDGGMATEAGLADVAALVFDARDNLFIADQGGVRRVDARTGLINTVAGHPSVQAPYVAGPDEGSPLAAGMVSVAGLAFSGGALYIADTEGGAFRRVDPGNDDLVTGDDPDETITELPDGIGLRAGLKWPQALGVDGGGRLYAGEWWHDRIHEIDARARLTTIVGAPDQAGTAGEGGRASRAGTIPTGAIAFAANGDMYFADSRLMRVEAIEGRVRPWSKITKLIDLPFVGGASHGTAVGGGKVYITEIFGFRIWEYDLETAQLSVLAGTGEYGSQDGPLESATMAYPCDLALDVQRGKLYFSDNDSHQIRVIDLMGRQVSTLFHVPSGFPEEEFSNVEFITLLGHDLLFLSDSLNQKIYRLDLRSSPPTSELVAGTGYDFPYGWEGDNVAATTTELADPRAIAFDKAGHLLVAERFTGRIRQIGVTDILPGALPNRIDRRSHEPIAVALLSTYDFDPGEDLVLGSIRVAGAPVELQRNGSCRRQRPDIDGDGRPDLVVYVRPDRLQLDASAIEAPITARRKNGGTFTDADWVTITH